MDKAVFILNLNLFYLLRG